MAFDQGDCIGEIASRASVSRIQDDRRCVEEAKFLIEARDRRLNHAPGPAMAAMGPVRTDCDRVKVGHGAALSLRAKRSNAALHVDCFAASLLAMTRSMLRPANLSPIPEAEAPRNCPLCPRLVRLREELRDVHPDWWNAPVPAFGDRNAWLAIVGLAPGKHGANRTGRPFTGDYAGELLYTTLLKFGLAEGEYRGDPGDGLRLKGAIILNAVKCLPPGNKPQPNEVATCRNYFEAGLAALTNVGVIVALGQIAHVASARALGLSPSSTKFGHGAEAVAPGGRILLSSYHCSRYNQNTGRLDSAMFESVFARALAIR